MTTFKEYQEFVKSLKSYPEEHAIIYPTIKLNGEAGEIAEKVGKALRGDYDLNDGDTIKQLLKECGDVLWYVGSLADDLGSSLEEVARMNYEKLSSRKERGIIKGNGDNR